MFLCQTVLTSGGVNLGAVVTLEFYSIKVNTLAGNFCPFWGYVYNGSVSLMKNEEKLRMNSVSLMKLVPLSGRHHIVHVVFS